MNATKCTHYAGTDTCSGTGAIEYGGGWYCQRCYAALRDHEDQAYGGASVIENPDPLVSLLCDVMRRLQGCFCATPRVQHLCTFEYS